MCPVFHSVHSVHSVVKAPKFEPWNHRMHGVHRVRIRALGVTGGKTWLSQAACEGCTAALIFAPTVLIASRRS
jgi:hypothetical protein